MDHNGSTQMFLNFLRIQNGSQWSTIVQYGQTQSTMDHNGYTQLFQNVQKWSKTVQDGPKWST